MENLGWHRSFGRHPSEMQSLFANRVEWWRIFELLPCNPQAKAGEEKKLIIFGMPS